MSTTWRLFQSMTQTRVDAGRLREHPLGGAVRVGLEGHRPDFVSASAVLRVPVSSIPHATLSVAGVDHLDRRLAGVGISSLRPAITKLSSGVT